MSAEAELATVAIVLASRNKPPSVLDDSGQKDYRHTRKAITEPPD